MSLTRYVQKRDFSRTPEPKGKTRPSKKRGPMFVIQMHAARRLHFDFRLEMGGVLKSWAVPKGLPARKGERRLAMQVEDHPLEYGGFEGAIPEGNYGAGTVMLWDKGTYEVLGEEKPLRALEEGKLHLVLHGKKLEGEWALVRMRPRAGEDKPAWLVIKGGEDLKHATQDKSVVSGKTMEQIARGRGKVWESRRVRRGNGEAAKRREAGLPAEVLAALEKLPAQEADFVAPMNALAVDRVPEGDNWIFEIKWDGYRAVAVKQQNGVKLFSRRNNNITADFLEIAAAVAKLPAKNFVLDGEIVALDESGHASFQRLQNFRQKSNGGQNLFYYIFDLMNLENLDLKGLALENRKQVLAALLQGADEPMRFSASLQGDAKLLLEEARKKRIEGLVAKRRDSAYQPGRRSGAWAKLKITCEQEFVIGGYTQPKGTRCYFGALAAGYYRDGRLYFAAKVGTGFDEERLKMLYEKMQPLKTERCPFVNLPSPSRRAGGLSPAEMRRCTWAQPKLVCEVRFTEWTEDGGLRQPVFLGLRDDKKPQEVVRETAVTLNERTPQGSKQVPPLDFTDRKRGKRRRRK